MEQPNEMRMWLERWAVNHARMSSMLESNALLRETAPISEALSRLSSIGLEALAFLERGQRPSAAWAREARGVLAAAPAPDFTVSTHMKERRSWPPPGSWWSDDKTALEHAELELVIVPAIARLVDRAAAQ